MRIIIKQEIIKRTSKQVDEGYFGFHDYTIKYEELDEFLQRVTDFLNGLDEEIISVSYPSCELAIITYKEL